MLGAAMPEGELILTIKTGAVTRFATLWLTLPSIILLKRIQCPDYR